MAILALEAAIADEDIADAVTGVKCVCIESYYISVAGGAKLYGEGRELGFLTSDSLDLLLESWLPLRHCMIVRASHLFLLVSLATVALGVNIEVTDIHTGVESLIYIYWLVTYFAADLFAHEEVSIAGLSRLWLSHKMHSVLIRAFYWLGNRFFLRTVYRSLDRLFY